MGAPVSRIEAVEQKTAEDLLSAFKHMAPADRRTHATVFNYWQSIRRDRELPPIRDLDALEISDAAPFGVLFELVEGGEDAQILHIGEALRDGVQASKLSEAANPSVLSCIGCKLGIVTISRDALAFEDHFLATNGTTRCSVTLLPFSASGDTVDFVYALVTLETGVTFVEETPEAAGEDVHPAVEAEAIADEPIAEEEAVAAEPVAEEPVAESEPEAPVEPEPATAQTDTFEEPAPVLEEPAAEAVAETQNVPDDMELPQFLTEPQPVAAPDAKPGFSKIFDALAGAKGFFGTVAPSEPDSEHVPEEPSAEDTLAEVPLAEEPVAEEPVAEEETFEEPAAGEHEAIAVEPESVTEDVAPVAEELAQDLARVANEATSEEPSPTAEEPVFSKEPVETPSCAMEGTLQSKLTEVRSKADEAKAARLRSEALLLEGLSAAYDFALDAEENADEYLKLVEAQGLKIQLRSPMKPVVKLAFDGYVDEDTIKQLESVLAWALKADLPKGTLAERIEAEGGMEAVLNGHKRRAGDAN
jgi:hypothetical protein